DTVEPGARTRAVFMLFFERLLELVQQRLLALAQADRGLDDHPAQQVAGIAALHRAHALAAQAKQLSTLGLGRYLELDPTFERRRVDLAAKRRGRERDRHLAIEVVAFTREDRMGFDADLDIEVAGRSATLAGLALARETDAV